MIVWLKFLHISAIAIWAAGLIGLPGLFLQRTGLAGDSLFRLQNLVRFAYVAIISPAAFLAIASGTALVFLNETFAPWFLLKLALIVLMVAAHTRTGMIIVRLFHDNQSYPMWRTITATIAVTLVITAILIVVLMKPAIDDDLLPRALSQPGALRSIVTNIIPWGR